MLALIEWVPWIGDLNDVFLCYRQRGCGWWQVPLPGRGEWKSSVTTSGELYVTISGTMLMPGIHNYTIFCFIKQKSFLEHECSFYALIFAMNYDLI